MAFGSQNSSEITALRKENQILAQEILSLESKVNILFLELENKNEKLETQLEENKRLVHNIEIYESAIAQSRRKLFAPSSERVVVEQLSVFNETEQALSGETQVLPLGGQSSEYDSESVTISEHKRKKRGRKPLPAHLPRIDVVLDLKDEEKFCPVHNQPLKEMNREVSEKIEIVPMQIRVIRTTRVKYTNPCCNPSKVFVAPVQSEMIPKSNATAGLLAYVATSKFCDCLPFYRLEKMFARYELDISRSVMAQWMQAVGERLLPLYDCLEIELLQSKYINCDETRVQVLDEEGRKPTSQSYMWVRARSGPKPIILFKYAPDRKGQTAKELLKGFCGFLQVDGYGGYNGVCAEGTGVIRLGCLYHVRRKFHASMKNSQIGKKIAEKVILLIKQISEQDEALRSQAMELRLELKQKKVRILFEKLRSVIDENLRKFPPKTSIAEAFFYAHNEWTNLEKYFEAPELELSNNFIENAIRPFALGRKNWLFFQSVEGAKASEVIYSIIETAKANGKEPYHYLKMLFEELPKTKPEDLKTLLTF